MVEHDRRSTNAPAVVAAAVISSPATSSAPNPFDTVRNSEQIPSAPVAVEATQGKTERETERERKGERGRRDRETQNKRERQTQTQR